jgi:capsular polysaccharide biosynthesis protein
MNWTSAEPSVPRREPPPLASAPEPPPRLARRQWLAILAACAGIVAVAVGSSILAGTLGATEYGARADIVYVAPASASLDTRERGLATQRGLATSRAVLDAVATDHNVSRRSLEQTVSVDIGARDDLMHITVGDADQAVAVKLAAAVAARYLRVANDLRPAGGAAAEPTPRLLSPAYPLDSPLSPRPLRLLAVGLLIGLALAMATAVAMARRFRAA